MLIEVDILDPEYAISLTNSEKGEIFYLPKNVFNLGLMLNAVIEKDPS